MYQKELQQLGLSANEAKTYLASLAVGSATVQEIASRAGLKRTTAYFAITRLMNIGLMSSFEKGKKTYFVAESPERLSFFIAAQRRKAQALEEDLQKILPRLNELFLLSGEQPRVRFFEGKEGIKAIQEDILRSGVKSIEEIFPADEFAKLFSIQERMPYIATRRRKKIRVRAMYTSKSKTLTGPIARDPFVEMKFISQKEFPVSADIAIYGTKTAIATYRGKLMGVIIESKEVAETLRSVFQLAWKATSKRSRR